MKIGSHRDLTVWQNAMGAAERVLELADEGLFAKKLWLSDQIQRAAASIPANIAEGHSGVNTTRSYLKHLFIARGSLAETLTFLELAVRRQYVGKEPRRSLWQQFQDVGRLLNGLIRALGEKLKDKSAKVRAKN